MSDWTETTERLMENESIVKEFYNSTTYLDWHHTKKNILSFEHIFEIWASDVHAEEYGND